MKLRKERNGIRKVKSVGRQFDNSFYRTARWYRHRLAQLRAEPLCRMCKEEDKLVQATVVDHIVPRSQGGDAWDWDNLQSLCESHHNSKTRKEQLNSVSKGLQ